MDNHEVRFADESAARFMGGPGGRWGPMEAAGAPPWCSAPGGSGAGTTLLQAWGPVAWGLQDCCLSLVKGPGVLGGISCSAGQLRQKPQAPEGESADTGQARPW